MLPSSKPSPSGHGPPAAAALRAAERGRGSRGPGGVRRCARGPFKRAVKALTRPERPSAGANTVLEPGGNDQQPGKLLPPPRPPCSLPPTAAAAPPQIPAPRPRPWPAQLARSHASALACGSQAARCRCHCRQSRRRQSRRLAPCPPTAAAVCGWCRPRSWRSPTHVGAGRLCGNRHARVAGTAAAVVVESARCMVLSYLSTLARRLG